MERPSSEPQPEYINTAGEVARLQSGEYLPEEIVKAFLRRLNGAKSAVKGKLRAAITGSNSPCNGETPLEKRDEYFQYISRLWRHLQTAINEGKITARDVQCLASEAFTPTDKNEIDQARQDTFACITGELIFAVYFERVSRSVWECLVAPLQSNQSGKAQKHIEDLMGPTGTTTALPAIYKQLRGRLTELSNAAKWPEEAPGLQGLVAAYQKTADIFAIGELMLIFENMASEQQDTDREQPMPTYDETMQALCYWLEQRILESLQPQMKAMMAQAKTAKELLENCANKRRGKIPTDHYQDFTNALDALEEGCMEAIGSILDPIDDANIESTLDFIAKISDGQHIINTMRARQILLATYPRQILQDDGSITARQQFWEDCINLNERIQATKKARDHMNHLPGEVAEGGRLIGDDPMDAEMRRHIVIAQRSLQIQQKALNAFLKMLEWNNLAPSEI